MVHFPNEIWLGVASYLELPSDVCTRKYETLGEDEEVTQQTLINLCLVSKQLRAIFQPQLYCSFIKRRRPAASNRLLKADSKWQHKYYQQDERSFRPIRKQTRLESFLVTIIHRPDLAAMVEQLRIGSFVESKVLPRRLQQLYKKVPLHKATSRAFVAALKSFKELVHLRKRFRRSWKESLKCGDEGAEVALLLTLLPNLRSLRFDSKTGSLNYLVKGLSNAILDPTPKPRTLEPAQGVSHEHPVALQSRLDQSSRFLRVLESLDLWWFDGYNISLGSCVGLLLQPSITSFHGRGLSVFESSLSFPPDTAFTSLRHLKLVRCKLDGEGLKNVLQRCMRLQSLEINAKFAFDSSTMSRILITTEHLEPLQNMTDTLERLTLMLPEYSTAVSLDLRGFNKLRCLHVDMNLLRTDHLIPLYMHESLPENIEKITIRRAYIWIQAHVDKLLDSMTANRRFSALSSLKVYGLDQHHKAFQDELGHTAERARALQLRFEVEEDPGFRYSWPWGHGDPDCDSDRDSD